MIDTSYLSGGMKWFLAIVTVIYWIVLIIACVVVSMQVAKESGHPAYGWACFLIMGWLMNISSNTRKR